MINISLHIAYLLTRHECVIVPDLGAFVVSRNENSHLKSNYLTPSLYLMGFNSDITHNDGLLANSIVKMEASSYKEANAQISQYVSELQEELLRKNFVQIPWVGRLSLSTERTIVFTPSLQMSCNVRCFGLNEFYIPLLPNIEDDKEDLLSMQKREKEETVYIRISKSKFKKGMSVAAALLALFFVSTPLNENTQRAGIISISTNKAVCTTIIPEVELINSKDESPENVALSDLRLESAKNNIRTYYIIIASLPTIDSANKMMEKLHQKEFPEANVISSGDKNRIFIKEFQDKQEAEIFLGEFRKNNPQYAKAWLLSQRSSK